MSIFNSESEEALTESLIGALKSITVSFLNPSKEISICALEHDANPKTNIAQQNLMRCFITINYFLVSSDVLDITKVRKKLTLQHYFQSKSINIGDIKSGRTVLLRMDYYASRGGFPQEVWDKKCRFRDKKWAKT
ncbi:MAG: hypothetical protein IKB68_05840 [Rikenellaceae bacterium]|nr:hypothetical protein [Rikenellaceae bacterium]